MRLDYMLKIVNEEMYLFLNQPNIEDNNGFEMQIQFMELVA